MLGHKGRQCRSLRGVETGLEGTPFPSCHRESSQEKFTLRTQKVTVELIALIVPAESLIPVSEILMMACCLPHSLGLASGSKYGRQGPHSC